MKMKKVMALGMTAALWIFSGCGGFSVRGTGEESAADGEDAQTGDGFRENGDGREAEDPQTADDSATKEDQTDSTASEAQTDEEMFTDRDYEILELVRTGLTGLERGAEDIRMLP